MVAHSSALERREDRLLATFERFERRVEHLEGALGRLEGATAQVPAVVATLTDVLDGLVERRASRTRRSIFT
jgi:hypothetical protein